MTSATARARAAARMLPRSVVIATPVPPHGVVPQFAASLLSTQKAAQVDGIAVDWVYACNIGYVPGARNMLAREFMRSAADVLVFIDSDVEWAPTELGKLITAPVDIVAAVHPPRHSRGGATFLASGPLVRDAATGLVEVDGASTCFMSIRRRAFEHVLAADPDIAVNATKRVHEFFPVRREPGVGWLGEDYGFCRLARRHGLKVWVDPTVKVTHWGVAPFVNDPLADMGLA